MKLEEYIIKDGKSLRLGYTTGSCATAAAKAATYMLITGKAIDKITIATPYGIDLSLEVLDTKFNEKSVSCAIKKDAGDDPDVTDGMLIYARVTRNLKNTNNITGGIGIGTITRKGLFGRIGEKAINPTPLKTIDEEVNKVSEEGFDIEIYAPMGVEVSKKTFNKNMGIEGGISIIGSTGIVRPMSDDALLKTIYLEIDQCVEAGNYSALFVLGNHGEDIAKELNINNRAIKISNFIGASLLYAYEKGIRDFTLIGHVGKFSKLSIGIFNTHNKIADTRMEAFVYYASLLGEKLENLKIINRANTSEEAVELIFENGMSSIIASMKNGIEERVKKYLKDDLVSISVVLYSMDRGVL